MSHTYRAEHGIGNSGTTPPSCPQQGASATTLAPANPATGHTPVLPALDGRLHSSHLALAVSRPWSAATRARSSGDLAPAMQKKFLLYMLLLRIRKALIIIFGGFPLNWQVNLLSKVIPPAPHKRGSQHLPNCRGPPRFVPPDVFQVFVACSATVKPSCFWCKEL